MQSLSLLWQLIRQQPRHLWLFIILFTLSYYLLLLGSLVITFANFPNYINAYNWPGNALEIFKATPSFKDAINILSEEWLLEIGYMNYDYGFGISEWSLNILPFKCLLVMLLGVILLIQWRLWRYCKSLACANPGPAKLNSTASKAALSNIALTTGSGAFLVALANMTMFWVVCCASPSWVVGLAMLGLVSVPVALMLDPWEVYVTLSGFSLLLVSLLWMARAAVNATAHQNVQPDATFRTPAAAHSKRDFANV